MEEVDYGDKGSHWDIVPMKKNTVLYIVYIMNICSIKTQFDEM